jgi:hypothetical protein
MRMADVQIYDKLVAERCGGPMFIDFENAAYLLNGSQL